MKKNLTSFGILSSFLLVGCQQSVDDLVVNENYPISIEASIGDAGGSRYSGDEPNDAAFAIGDNIGLAYTVGTETATDFVEWTLSGSGWSPATAMNWKNIGDDHTFYAFYPYSTDASLSEISMPDLANQDGTMTSVAACDFLVATKTQSYSDAATVSFTGVDAFDHVSSLVVLTLKNTANLASATIRSISLTGTNLVAPTTYSFIDNEETDADEADRVTLTGNAVNEITASFSNVVMDNDQIFYFVVNPGTVTRKNVTLSITYQLTNGEIYTATKEGLHKDDEDNGYFDSGYFYNYGITVSTGNVLTITGHDIKPWKDGDSFDITIDNSQKQNQNS